MMGTLVDVVLYPDSPAVQQAVVTAFGRMNQIEGGAYRQRVEIPFTPNSDLDAILDAGLAVSKASSGAFDPTLGEVIKLWGFDTEKPGIPDPDDMKVAIGRVGYQRLDPSSASPSVSQGRDPVWLDLGGVAKGFAVDEAVQILSESSATGGIVNAGGDLRAFGKKAGGKPWKIGVQDPDNPQELAGVLSIREAAVATSGDYQRYFEEGGVRYHHILDPATGYPARSGLRGATVIAPDCALADALATAAFVLGPEKGLKLLEEWDGVEGVLITEDGKILTTSGIGKTIPFEER